jgi:hypothetical protein
VTEDEQVRAALDALNESRDAWKALGPDVQGEVMRLARQGEHHPNRRVASTAYRWACTVVAPNETTGKRARDYLRVAAPGVITDVIANLLLGGSGTFGSTLSGVDVATSASERRAAKDIIRVGQPGL